VSVHLIQRCKDKEKYSKYEANGCKLRKNHLFDVKEKEKGRRAMAVYIQALRSEHYPFLKLVYIHDHMSRNVSRKEILKNNHFLKFYYVNYWLKY